MHPVATPLPQAASGVMQRDFDVQHRFAGALRSVRVHMRGAPNGRPPCIALHSGPGFGSASLMPGCDDIARVVQVAFIDLPGCGESSHHAGSGYPMAAFVADVWAVHDALGAPTSLLLGHGWGAILAAEAALAMPAATAGLLLVNPLRILAAAGQDHAAQARRMAAVAPGLPEEFARDVWPLVQQAQGDEQHWPSVDAQPWWGRVLDTQWATTPTPAWREAIAAARFGMEAYFAHKGQAFFDPGSPWGRYDLAASLARVHGPVTVLAAEDDANYVAPPAVHALPLVSACAALQLHLVRGVGHFMLSEAPQAVAGFMQRHPALQPH
jgi:pimeloyl-ACP methyl ester carboxylesterase